MSVERQRVYDYRHKKPTKDDHAVLVDRIWPRGISKRELSEVEWLRELAPSTELRKWFAHRESRWEEFKERYRRELHSHSDTLARLRKLAEEGHLILLYGAKDTEHNQAVVLESLIGHTPETGD